MFIEYFVPTIITVCISATALADSFHHDRSPQRQYQGQSHAGQVDTDGILSPGEVRNPNIDYDRTQRRAEGRDESRVENPYNDDAADDVRYYKEQEHERDERNEHDRDWRDQRDEGRDHKYSWWPW